MEESYVTKWHWLVFWAFTFFCLLLITFLWSPVSYYFGKWNDWWQYSDFVHQHTQTKDESERIQRYNSATNECYTKAKTYFKSETLITLDSPDDYKTYTCYGIKYEEIK